MTTIFHDPLAWRRARLAQTRALLTLGFVPTMGALHEGHLSLVRRSQQENDRTLVSIFVNPTQFDDPADLASYPHTLDDDLETLAAEGADFIFLPHAEDLYPDGYRYRVTERRLSNELEGAHRPGHFDGVLTVVLKLLHIAQPERAYFGEKDWQQLDLVRGMAEAFFLPTTIVGCTTVRDSDGLALSSRNQRLVLPDRRRAALFHRALASAPTADDASRELRASGFAVDYVEDREGRRLGAVRLGGVRLIDNVTAREPIMNLALDVGNGHIFGGVFESDELTVRFRKASWLPTSSDELGLFLRAVLRENDRDPARIDRIALCSVVPGIIYPLRSCCRKYFHIDPFVLQSGARTGLKIRYRNPLEVGADRIANALGAVHLYPGRHLIIVDFGTATTFDVVSANRDYLGGIILPGVRIGMESLEKNTARLPTVEIVPSAELVGRSTVECIQSGLYFGNRAIVKELTRDIRDQAFRNEPVVVIGTGGFSRLFEREALFDAVIPDLILVGLERALSLNQDASKPWAETGTRDSPQ